MKQASYKSFLVLLLVATFLSATKSDDSCPSGMRKMYLNEETATAYGTARTFMPALNFYEGNGALWFNRKILLEPRFEVHLKASIEPVDVIESTDEQTLEGFTIVLSGVKNTVGKGNAEQIGYYGFTKSYIIEFDFNKQAKDVSPSSYSFKYCDTDCTSDDSKALISGKIINQIYDGTKTNEWDFRLVYSDHELLVYSGPNEILFAYEVDLEEKLGSYIANVGFTGYMRGSRRELNLFGTFVCEDNFDMTKMDGLFYIKDTTYETATYGVGDKVFYLFQFKNNQGQVIPHCYKNNIWDYNLSLALDCQGSNVKVSVKDDYSLFLTMNACSDVGQHSIAIREASHGDGPVRYYNVISGGDTVIQLIGHDGIIDTVPTEEDKTNKAKVLKYGPLKGDFSLTDGLKIVLDFSITDQYGNSADIGESSDEMLIKSDLSLVSNKGAKVSMEKKDSHFQFIIEIKNIGTYIIKKNKYMSEAIEFIVLPGPVDVSNSYCTIEGASEAKTLNQGEKIQYSCYFRDANRNEITPEEFEERAEYEFSCNVAKKEPTTGTFDTTVTVGKKAIVCEYTATSAGTYAFIGSVMKIGSSIKTELPAQINNFFVSALFKSVSLVGAKIYNPNTLLWYDLAGFSYVYLTDSTGFLTAIDLTDADHTTLISTLGNYPTDFNFAGFKAYLLSPHDADFSVALEAKRASLLGKEYVGIYTKGGVPTDDVVKKSSFEYRIKLVWDGQEKLVTLRYKFAQPATIGSYTTCFHDLDEKSTEVNFDSIDMITNNEEQYLGQLILKTKDGFLYNYNIGLENIKMKLEATKGSAYFKIATNVVQGVYDLYGKASDEFTGTITFTVNGAQITKTITVKPGDAHPEVTEGTTETPTEVKSDGKVNTSNSFYTLLQNKIKPGETAFVDVVLKDSLDYLLGQTDGALDKAKSGVKVTATAGSTKYDLTLDSVTGGYALRFKNTIPKEGTYTVSATYDGKTLACPDKTLRVTSNDISLQNSQMSIILDKTIAMSEDTTQTVQNTQYIPKYKLVLYNEDNQTLSSYDKNIDVSCYMTKDGETTKTPLKVDKQDGYIMFTHDTSDPSKYPQLNSGYYYLHVTLDGQTKDYKLYLTGNTGKYSSSDDKYDLSNTETSYAELHGQAGKVYQAVLTFHSSDGSKWNNGGDLSKFSFKNSYNLKDNEFSVEAENGVTNGQFILNINQTRITDENKPNILSIYYNGEELPVKVKIYIKNGDLAKLEYVSGCEDGTVDDSIILKYIPYDAYGNLYTDLFNSTITDQAILDRLTKDSSSDGISLSSDSYITDNKYLNVEYQLTATTTVTVGSDYTKDVCSFTVKSGALNLGKTYAVLQPNDKLTAGSTYNLIIYPRDKFNNVLDTLTSSDLKKFVVWYVVKGTGEKKDITDTCKLVYDAKGVTKANSDKTSYNAVQCSTEIDQVGEVEFFVNYKDTSSEEEVECRSCLINIGSGDIDFKKLQTVYINTNTLLSTTKNTIVDTGVSPLFEVTFFDKYGNLVTDSGLVEKLDLAAELGTTDVKLCVSNSGNKKLITVCPPSNGDDNTNKWKYLTNGDNYKLILKGTNTITYPLELAGGDGEGSSAAVDLSKTYLDPSKFTLTAGEEGRVFMELRTSDGKRKNYWYPNAAETIKVNFAEDAGTCQYTVTNAEKPGQYYIVFSCTKANDANNFSISVDGNKLTKKVDFAVNPGKAYYLEPTEPTLFDVDGNRYTFKSNFVNGDKVSFKFKLLDKYKNYINTDFNKAGTAVLSEVYGTKGDLYKVDYTNDNYVFTDKTDEYNPKHTWDIKCLESGNVYYFTYEKVPGDVDLTKSDFTVDRTKYYLKDTSTVEVTLKDKYGVNVGVVPGRLETERKLLTVTADGDKNLVYEFNSISNKNTLIYKLVHNDVGKYDVTANYNKKGVADKSVSTIVSYLEHDPNRSLVYYNYNGEKYMLQSTQTNVNNKEEYPDYHIYIANRYGYRIENYNKSVTVSCKMTKGNDTWELVATKKDGVVVCAYQDSMQKEFSSLPAGDYKLVVNVDDAELVYPLHFLGGNGDQDGSNSSKYNTMKTLVTPIRIDGIAGEEYKIGVELRAADGLRWDKEVQLSSLTVANSYGLSSKDLVIDKKLGDKNGQAVIYLRHYKSTVGLPDNVLTLSYEGNELAQKVNVAMKPNKLAKLELISELKDNYSVSDPATLKFVPYDQYGNVVTDLFDPSKYDEAALQQLTKGTSRDKYDLVSNNYVSDGKYLNVNYKTDKATTIDVTSPYFKDTYTYRLNSGDVSQEKTYAELLSNTNKVAGNEQEIVIHPKDVYGNDVTDLKESDLKKYVVIYENVETKNKHDISNTCKLVDNTIHCKSPIEEAGDIQFYAEYLDNPLNCKNCLTNIIPGEVDYTKTTSVYVNNNKEMKTTESTQVQASVTPTFEITYHDKYGNAITDPSVTKKLDTKATFEDTDVDLCVEDKDNHKIVTVCQTDNGENKNKWNYLVNGNNYNLIITNNNKKISFPAEVIGGSNDYSSGKVSSEKTYVDNSLTLTAGEEKKFLIELRTDDDNIKNYWYLNPEEHIKVNFDKDKDSCSYRLVEAGKPGQYYVYVKCTKSNDQNTATVTIDGKEVDQKVALKINAADPETAKLFTLDDQPITTDNLGSVSVNDRKIVKEIFYDKYGNQITDPSKLEKALDVTLEPNVAARPDTEYGVETVIQPNGNVLITLTSNLAGEHVMKGDYLPKDKYKINFTHGEPYCKNSYIKVQKDPITAGDTNLIYIYPYDKYNNKIDASEFKAVNPFSVDVALHTEVGVMDIYLSDYEIKQVDGQNVIVYPFKYNQVGNEYVNAYVGDCRLKLVTFDVVPKDISFKNSSFSVYDEDSDKFVTVTNNSILQNTVDNPIYRICPTDEYGNVIEYIPEEKIVTDEVSEKKSELTREQARKLDDSWKVTLQKVVYTVGNKNVDLTSDSLNIKDGSEITVVKMNGKVVISYYGGTIDNDSDLGKAILSQVDVASLGAITEEHEGDFNSLKTYFDNSDKAEGSYTYHEVETKNGVLYETVVTKIVNSNGDVSVRSRSWAITGGQVTYNDDSALSSIRSAAGPFGILSDTITIREAQTNFYTGTITEATDQIGQKESFLYDGASTNCDIYIEDIDPSITQIRIKDDSRNVHIRNSRAVATRDKADQWTVIIYADDAKTKVKTKTTFMFSNNGPTQNDIIIEPTPVDDSAAQKLKEIAYLSKDLSDNSKASNEVPTVTINERMYVDATGIKNPGKFTYNVVYLQAVAKSDGKIYLTGKNSNGKTEQKDLSYGGAGVYYKLNDKQILVVNVDTSQCSSSTSLQLPMFMISVDGGKNYRQSAGLDGDIASQQLIFNFPGYKGQVESDKFAGVVIIPEGTVQNRATSHGQYIAKNMKIIGGDEIHGNGYSESSSTMSFTRKGDTKKFTIYKNQLFNAEKINVYHIFLRSKEDGTEYYMKLQNKKTVNQACAVYERDDQTNGGLNYTHLEGGDYDLVFVDEKGNSITYHVTIESTNGDTTNKDIDIQKTYVTSTDLNFTAGEEGEMYIELRTEDNLRKNSWEDVKIEVQSCDIDDDTFEYKVEESGVPGVYRVTVTTEKATNKEKCELTIKVNKEVVKELHPELNVTAGEAYNTEIKKEYWKTTVSSDVLKDGNADNNTYSFEVITYDKYGNEVKTDQNTVGVTVTHNGEEVNTINEVTESGSTKYTVTTTDSGEYTITTNTNSEKGDTYLTNDSTFTVNTGEVYTVIVTTVKDEITAGENGQVTITTYDKNGNEISAEDFKNKFDVTFTDSNNNVYDSSSTIDTTTENTNTVTYTTNDEITKTGTVTINVESKDNDIAVDTTDVKINVVPGEATDSTLTRQISEDSYVVYHKGDTIIVDTDDALIFNLTLYDEYGNKITDVINTTVDDATMTGNNMDTITFDVTKNTDNYNLDFINQEDAVDTYTHLVDGDYKIQYDVKNENSGKETRFDYNIVVKDSGDENHGNGGISEVVLKTTNDEASTAGQNTILTLELRTNEGKLYNNEVNTDDIKIVTDRTDDKTFKYTVEKTDEAGVYNVIVYTEKKGNEELHAVVTTDEETHTTKESNDVDIKIIPDTIPYRPYTEILTQPGEQVNANETVEITYILYDKYGNQFEDRQDIIDNNYLTVTNNGEIVTTSTKDISENENGNTFTVTLPAIYPPKDMNINVVYNDGNNSVINYREDVHTEINVGLDTTQTKVTSTNAQKIKVGEILDMQLYLFDQNGYPLGEDDYSDIYTITVTGPEGDDSDVKTYKVEKVYDDTLETQNKYNIITTDDDKYTKTGTYDIVVTGGNDTVATFTQICYTDEYSINGFLLKYVEPDFDPDHVPIDKTIKFVVSGSDEYGNEFTAPLIDDMEMDLTIDGKSSNFESSKIEAVSGQLEFDVDCHVVGEHQLHLYYKGEEVLTVNWGEPLPIFNIEKGPCRAENNDHFNLSPLDEAVVEEQTHFTFQCYDSYGNKITEGGEEFVPDAIVLVEDTQTPVDATVVDNGDGTYDVVLTPPVPGTYVIGLTVDDGIKYGEPVEFVIEESVCQGEKPIMCPNMKKCVSNRIKCIIPENDCPASKPFECLVDGVMTCVKSQNDCDCPKGFIRCTDFMHYCVPENRPDMCPFFLPSNKLCKRQNKDYIMYEDGICRISGSAGPSQPVCPIGKVLCADLSCRDSYPECMVSEYCDGTEVRCADQTCASGAAQCPSVASCSNQDYVMCPDGTCVENEIYCEAVPVCPKEHPYLCANLQCTEGYDYCPKKVACGDGKLFCEDNICRTTCE